MAVPVLATKIYIPPLPPKVVTRSRLIDLLDEGIRGGCKLTLISAPAGFGKSTLVCEWIVSCGRRAAWVSLDENDHDPTRFLIYLIAAIQTITPGLGAEILESLQSSQAPSTESLLTALLNDIAGLPDNFILVLDDYHLVDARSVDDVLTFLIDHLPPQIHLVITTREDPTLPIPRLRARNQLTEIRAMDLRFTPAEAAGFLNQVMDLGLSAEDVSALDVRTEGWIAGLQLAALSMKGQQDVHGFIQAFTGDHRYIVDYLVEEVLQRQPTQVRNFLLQTSILERLNGSLCDAVLEQAGGRAQLESLQRRNFFLIPLDDRRHWYRYHHLFGDVLRMHLITEQPDRVPMLHRRASLWFEQNGSAPDAIRHALAARDFERAADLVELSMMAMGQSRQEVALLGWFRALPEEVFQRRPVLSVHYAGALLQNGYLDGVESRLRDAERWLDLSPDAPEQPIFADAEGFKHLPGLISMYHAGIALAQGDVPGTLTHAQRVLELASQDDDFLRGAGSSLLGLAYWTSGDLERAYRTFSEGMAHLERIGFLSDVIGGSVTLADIRLTQGRLREAMSIYERGLQLATKGPGPALRGAADMHVGLSEIHRERNDLYAATEHLMKSRQLGELNGLPKNPNRWCVAMARIHKANGDLDEALTMLDEAERVYTGDFSPNVRPISAWKARVRLAQGNLDQAAAWAREQGLSAEDEPSYLREFEHITLAGILMAQHTRGHSPSPLRMTIGLLERLLTAAEEGGRMGSAIEILALQSLAYQLQGNIPRAFTSLERALILAEPEGYIRVFVDEGEGMRTLIEDFRSMIENQSRRSDEHLIPYTGILLDAFPRSPTMPLSSLPPIKNQQSKFENLPEPLSQRELDILRLFKTELSGPEIAQELVIALSTVRTHTKSIYGKLGVNSRRAAVKRAEELGLI